MANGDPRLGRWRLATTVAVAFAVTVAVGFTFGRAGNWPGRAPLQKLVAAANGQPYRPVLGRLSGGFSYHRPRRGAGGRESAAYHTSMSVLSAVTKSGKMTASNRTHVVGLGFLIAGMTDEAIRHLEQSAVESVGADDMIDAFASERDAQLLSDLSAAYLDRRATIFDAFLAVEAAERAWNLRRSPETAWNRALAREAIHVRAAALEAWNDYLQLEPQSPWTGEAIEHVRRLASPSRAQRWAAMHLRVEQPGTDYDVLAREFPQELRTYGEETMLPRWADFVVRGSDSARRALQIAHEIGAAVKRQGGDQLLADSVAVIECASSDGPELQRLAAAHLRYAAARNLLGKQLSIAAASEFAAAERLLGAEHTPFAARAAMFGASAEYYSGRLGVAISHLDRILNKPKDTARYPALVGQVEWVRGLAEGSRGNNNETAQALEAASAAFAHAGEAENRAGIETLLASLHRSVGNEIAAFADRQRALTSLEELGTTRRSHSILTEAAIAANASQLPFTALVFQNALVTISRTTHDPVSLADALISRSAYAAAAGDRRLAEADLREGRRLTFQIVDPAMRTRCTGNLLAAEAVVWRTFDPERAAFSARAALDEMEKLGHRTVMVRLRLEEGRALHATGKDARALQSWRYGIEECERQRADLTAPDDRRNYFEQCRALFDESIGLMARGGHFADAFALAERGRARGLLETLQRDAQPLTGTFTLEQATAIEYSVLPNAVVVWTIGPKGPAGLIRKISRKELRATIDGMRSETATPEDFRRYASKLYDLLIRPVEDRLARRVVVVPDTDLYHVSFAALWDRRKAHYLVENHELSIVPSLALLTSSRPERWEAARLRAVLIDAGTVANEASGTTDLASVQREIATLSRMYANAVVVPATQCTKARVVASLLDAEVVHFAGHSISGSSLIDEALVLRASNDDAGLLSPREIAALPLSRTRLVVLGACGTADGRVGSEGAMSIGRAFLAAGAERVVATLWRVEDERSRVLLTELHRSLCSGTDPVAALRQVQITAIRKAIPARHWGAFEVVQRGI